MKLLKGRRVAMRDADNLSTPLGMTEELVLPQPVRPLCPPRPMPIGRIGKSGRVLLALMVLAGSALAAPVSTLKSVEWQRDEEKINLISLVFVFDKAPEHYPAYQISKPAAVHIDFAGTRLAKNIISPHSVPPPLMSFMVTEKTLKDASWVTQVDVGVESSFPFYTRKEGNRIFLVLDVEKGYKKHKVLVEKGAEGSANTIKNITIQSMENYLEILVTLSKEPIQFPTYPLEDPYRLVMDLPGVILAESKEEDLDMAPIETVKLLKQNDFSSLVFGLKGKAEYRTIQKDNRISILVSYDKRKPGKGKRWIYVAAGALLLGGVGGGISVLAGGEEAATPPEAGDDWGEPPPDPNDLFQ